MTARTSAGRALRILTAASAGLRGGPAALVEPGLPGRSPLWKPLKRRAPWLVIHDEDFREPSSSVAITIEKASGDDGLLAVLSV